ncbi:phosphoribosylformylglycinamidine cyclo-ligase [Chloroflexota bacterium]
MAAEYFKSKYAEAGVNIDANERAVKLIAKHTRSTFGPNVLNETGFFGGMYEFKGYEHPVLVSSVDGVGTKLKIAITLDKHETVGIDIVNHCINDIFSCGAEPLFFLDYIGTGKLLPEQAESVIKGIAVACRDAGCALIGGEMAEMPDVYGGKDYDLVGCIVGVVEKDKIIDGSTITVGDIIIGLSSSGLHTNGYSLVRKILGDTQDKLDVHYPELGGTLGDVLLEPHRCYYNQVKPLLPLVKGIAHITGGGLIENVPRILPNGLTARFHSEKWTIPPIFQLIERKGHVTRQEMYRVFNMGIGMILVCSPDNASQLWKSLPESYVIGEVMEQGEKNRVVIQ